MSAPRPFSRLCPVTGKIEWVLPGEPYRAARLETDEEVRVRIGRLPFATGLATETGQALDKLLANLGLEPRKTLPEVP